MEYDSSQVWAPVLPEALRITEYFDDVSEHDHLVVATTQSYDMPGDVYESLYSSGLVLRQLGVAHPSGAVRYELPAGLISLSSFLNATSVDQHRDWKRRHIFGGIKSTLQSLGSQCLTVAGKPNATRFMVGLTSDAAAMVLLPVNVAVVREGDVREAVARNKDFMEQMMSDIVTHAPPDDSRFNY